MTGSTNLKMQVSRKNKRRLLDTATEDETPNDILGRLLDQQERRQD